MRLLLVVAALVATALVYLTLRGEGDADGSQKTTREPPSTTLRHGEQVTYLPGEVVPGETVLRCMSKGIGGVVPRPGEEAVAFVDPRTGPQNQRLR